VETGGGSGTAGATGSRSAPSVALGRAEQGCRGGSNLYSPARADRRAVARRIWQQMSLLRGVDGDLANTAAAIAAEMCRPKVGIVVGSTVFQRDDMIGRTGQPVRMQQVGVDLVSAHPTLPSVPFADGAPVATSPYLASLAAFGTATLPSSPQPQPCFVYWECSAGAGAATKPPSVVSARVELNAALHAGPRRNNLADVRAERRGASRTDFAGGHLRPPTRTDGYERGWFLQPTVGVAFPLFSRTPRSPFLAGHGADFIK